MSLYKYLPPERVDVLERLQIRFSPAVSANDAFELKPLTKGWASTETAKAILVAKLKEFFRKADTPEKMLQISIANHPEAEVGFRKSMEVLGASEWFGLMKESVERNLENAASDVHLLVEQNWDKISANFLEMLGTQVGILSLSEDPYNRVMWGHYSDSSRGFVIGFDERHPWFNQKRTENDELCHVRKVTYVREDCPKYFSELTGQDVAYSKLDVWRYEKEWRMLFPLQRGIDTHILDSFGQPVIVFPIPEDCLTGIIIGSRASDELSGKIEMACRMLKRQIPISKGTW